MTNTTRTLTRAAICAAAGVVILLLSSLLPSARLAFAAIASLGVIFIFMTSSWKWALGTYAVTAGLSLLLLPGKIPALLYACFFGFYPIIKLCAERLRRPFVRWSLKLGVFNAAFLVFYLTFVKAILFGRIGTGRLILILLVSNLVFLIYDYALKKLILFYLRKIAGRVK